MVWKKYHLFVILEMVIKMSKVSKELIEFKKLLEEDEIETYKNETIEELNLDFLIDYVYEHERERIFNSLH